MKKTYTLFLSVIMLISTLLCSCQSSKPKELETIIYGATESNNIFRANEKAYEKFEARYYKENVSKNTITIDVLGAKYTGIYNTTVKMPRSDIEVYEYKIQGTDIGEVLINTKTNAIVRYVNVPHNENLTNENDYIAFVKRILGENYDLNEYNYECSTHYYYHYPDGKGFQSQMVDGFRILEENDRLGSYCLQYNKPDNGVGVQNFIYAEIGEDSFYLDISEPGYKSTDFSPILDRMDEVEENVEKHLRDNIKDGLTLVSIEHGTTSLFIQDGIPYVRIFSTVTYKAEHGGEYSTIIQTITG